MSNLIDFLIRHKNTLLFLFLLCIALGFTFQYHSFQRSKVVSSTNYISGTVHSWDAGVGAYFSLKQENDKLQDENKRLRQYLYNERVLKDSAEMILDTVLYEEPFRIRAVKVIANRYRDLDNYILINKGEKDSIKPEYGVMTSHGILGVVEAVSPHFSRVISILNTNLAINAQLKNSEHFGTLTWDGRDPNVVNLTDIPRVAEVHKGDTIMTNGRSLIFPKGILIGTVEKAGVRSGQNFYDIQVRLFNDMTAVGRAYVIENDRRAEADSLRVEDEE